MGGQTVGGVLHQGVAFRVGLSPRDALEQGGLFRCESGCYTGRPCACRRGWMCGWVTEWVTVVGWAPLLCLGLPLLQLVKKEEKPTAI